MRWVVCWVSVLLSSSTVFAQSNYVGSASTVSASAPIQSAAMEILGDGGGAGAFIYKGGGNAVDAAVACALAACVVNPGNASLGAYGGHMMIYKSGWDGDPALVTCINFDSTAGSLATSNMFANSVDPVTGTWTGPTPAANQYGWKAAGVPGAFAGLYMAQTNYGRKISGTNYFPFAEVLKPALARIANGQAISTAYYSLTAVSNLVMDLYTNSDPYAVFYSGDIAQDIVAAMQANSGLVTYADMTNYRPREVTPYARHFAYPNGTAATVYVAPPGSSGVSVLQEMAFMEALGWTNGPTGTWDSLHYWHARAEAARLMWKDHYQYLGDPSAGVTPPDFLGNGSTNFCDQFLAHATNGYRFSPAWDSTEIVLTNSVATTIAQAVNAETNVQIAVHWNDIRYGTRNITTCDRWGNCVAVTFSMGGGYGAQVAVTNRGLVFGQSMALFDPRPGWPNSIAPGKRQVDNMCPAIVVPDTVSSPANAASGRPPFAVGGVGGSTIENNMAMQLMEFLSESPNARASASGFWMYNFEANKTIYMRPSYPSGVQAYLGTVGLTAGGSPSSVGEISFAEAFIAPTITSQPGDTNVTAGSKVVLNVSATGLPLFFQWKQNGVSLSEGGNIDGSKTPSLTISNVTNSAAYWVVVTNGALSVTSALANVIIPGPPTIGVQPASVTNVVGTTASFSVTATGSGPLSYQWRKNGTDLADAGNVSGAKTSLLTVSSVSANDVGSYVVVVSNSSGSVTSAPATLSITQVAASHLFLYEPFVYTNVGGPVSSNTPANWTYNGTGSNDLNVAGGNLTYPGLATSVGNSVTNGGNGLGVRRLFGTNFSSGVVYFSALYRINDLGFGAWNGSASQVGALTPTDNVTFRLQVMVRSNSPNGYVVGVQKGGSGAANTWDTVERTTNDTLFLVGKYDFTVSPNKVTLWINPGAAAFGGLESSGGITQSAGADGYTIDRFNMRQNAASGASSVPANMQWDELRFGLSWADVTPPATNSSAQWSSITANGDSYEITWIVNSGTTYQFQYKNELSETAWHLITNVTPVSSMVVLSNTATNTQRFYELVTGP